MKNDEGTCVVRLSKQYNATHNFELIVQARLDAGTVVNVQVPKKWKSEGDHRLARVVMFGRSTGVQFVRVPALSNFNITNEMQTGSRAAIFGILQVLLFRLRNTLSNKRCVQDACNEIFSRPIASLTLVAEETQTVPGTTLPLAMQFGLLGMAISAR